MWRILQHNEADDFVLATGEMHSVRAFCEAAFAATGVSLRWEGTGVDEKGYDANTGACLIQVDERYFRPTEVEQLLGDPTKAKEKLGWVATTPFADLVAEMVTADRKLLETERLARRAYGANE